jgi:hypothetical protein
VSGLVNVPASALKPLQLSPLRVPVSRVTVALDTSMPAPPSVPLPSVNVTGDPSEYAEPRLIVCPAGAVVSSEIVMLSVASFDALSVAVTVRAPGAAAPALHVSSAPLVDQPVMPERSGYVTLRTAVSASELVDWSRKLPLPVLRK